MLHRPIETAGLGRTEFTQHALLSSFASGHMWSDIISEVQHLDWDTAPVRSSV